MSFTGLHEENDIADLSLVAEIGGELISHTMLNIIVDSGYSTSGRYGLSSVYVTPK